MKDEERVTRWIDGQLKNSEIKDLLEANPSLQDERHAMRKLGQMVREEIPPERDVPFPELFNRQVMKRIEEEKEKTLANRLHHFFFWLTTSDWGLPMASAATLVVLFGVGLQVQKARHFGSKVVHTFTPNPAHVAKAQENQKAGVTVISLQGLTPLPESAQILGYLPTKSNRERLMATTTFYEGKAPLVRLSMNTRGEPRLQHPR